MSRMCALAAWLCATLGLSLLVCSTVLVPDSLALADDGGPCGMCGYQWNGQSWVYMGNSCTGQCTCPGPPAGSGSYVNEIWMVACTGAGEPCSGMCGYQWSAQSESWTYMGNNCMGSDCGCPGPPTTSGSYNGETQSVACINLLQVQCPDGGCWASHAGCPVDPEVPTVCGANVAGGPCTGSTIPECKCKQVAKKCRCCKQ